MLLFLLLYPLQCGRTIRFVTRVNVHHFQFIGSFCLQGIDHINSYLLKETIVNTFDEALVDTFFFFDFAAAGTLGAEAFLLVA